MPYTYVLHFAFHYTVLHSHRIYGWDSKSLRWPINLACELAPAILRISPEGILEAYSHGANMRLEKREMCTRCIFLTLQPAPSLVDSSASLSLSKYQPKVCFSDSGGSPNLLYSTFWEEVSLSKWFIDRKTKTKKHQFRQILGTVFRSLFEPLSRNDRLTD